MKKKCQSLKWLDARSIVEKFIINKCEVQKTPNIEIYSQPRQGTMPGVVIDCPGLTRCEHDLKKRMYKFIIEYNLEPCIHCKRLFFFGIEDKWIRHKIDPEELYSSGQSHFELSTDLCIISPTVIDIYAFDSLQDVLASIEDVVKLVKNNEVFSFIDTKQNETFYLLLATKDGKFYKQELEHRTSHDRLLRKYLEPIQDVDEIAAILNAGVRPTYILESEIDMDTLID